MAAITIKDIAHELHFSVSTVSRALQNHPDISEETKKIITNYAREHHYRPNQMASSLRTQKVTTIGLILPELTSYFFSTILEGVEKAANVAGYNVLIARTKEDPEHEKQCLQMLDNARVAGIIACPTKRTFDFRPYENMIQQGVPMVVVDRYSPLNCDQVISDDFGGAFQAVEYLIQTGCKRIVMLTTPFSTAAVLERQRGYKAALEHYNFTYSEQNIHYADTREEAVREASAFFAQEQRLTAITQAAKKTDKSFIVVLSPFKAKAIIFFINARCLVILIFLPFSIIIKVSSVSSRRSSSKFLMSFGLPFGFPDCPFLN